MDEGQFNRRLRQFREGDPRQHHGYMKAGPIAGAKIPLIPLFLRALVLEYPSAMDIGTSTWLSGVLPFLVAGLFDYSTIITFTYTSLALLRLLPESHMRFPAIAVQPVLVFISLTCRIRIAGGSCAIAAFRQSYREVLGGLKIWLVLIKVCPAIFWFVTIDCICGPDGRRRIGLLVFQALISSITGFWDDSAEKFVNTFSNGTSSQSRGEPTNETLYTTLKRITGKAAKDTYTNVPIELFLAIVPAFLLLAQSSSPHLQAALSLAMSRWTATAEKGWTWVLKKMPGPHPIDSDEVEKNLSKHPGPNGMPRYIRLLTVEPGLFDDTVHCSLGWFDLDKAHPPYTAISYVWGATNATNSSS